MRGEMQLTNKTFLLDVEASDTKMKKWTKTIKNEIKKISTQNPRRFPGCTVVVVILFDEILDDFHVCFRNASLSVRKSTTQFEASSFSVEKWRFSLDVKQNTHFTDENQRKKSLRSAPLAIIVFSE